jgi:hypothetical protein
MIAGRLLKRAVIALGLVFAGMTCSPIRYQPTLPMQARSGDLSLHLRQLRLGRSKVFTFDSQSTAVHTIRQGWLTVATREPCSGGEEAGRIAIDGGGSTLSPGTHQLRIDFRDPPTEMGIDLVVDLQMDDGRCARVPALSQSVPMEAGGRFVVMLTNDNVGGEDLRGFRSSLGGSLGAGAWLGPVLLTAQAGVGLAVCNTSACGEDKDGNNIFRVTFPMAVDALYSLEPTVALDGLSAWLVGVSYGFVPVRLSALEGERRFGVHRFHLTPGAGLGMFRGGDGPFLGTRRSMVMQVLFPVGVHVDPGGPTRTVGLSGGLVFRVLLPLGAHGRSSRE